MGVPNLIVDVYTGVLTPKVVSTLPKGILMRVEGIFGVIGISNKNKRKYTRSLWEKVIFSDETQSKLKLRNLYGEADHPEGLFASLQRASHVVTGLGVREVEGQTVVWGEADILDTPSGRILKTLFDARCAVGISSRGAGSLISDSAGVSPLESQLVSEEDYVYGGHDFVADPACEGSYPRPVEVVESLKQTLISNLTESQDQKDEYLKDRTYYDRVVSNFLGSDVANELDSILAQDSMVSEKVDVDYDKFKLKAADTVRDIQQKIEDREKEVAGLKKQAVEAEKGEKEELARRKEYELQTKKNLDKQDVTDSVVVGSLTMAEIITRALKNSSDVLVKERERTNGLVKTLEEMKTGNIRLDLELARREDELESEHSIIVDALMDAHQMELKSLSDGFSKELKQRDGKIGQLEAQVKSETVKFTTASVELSKVREDLVRVRKDADGYVKTLNEERSVLSSAQQELRDTKLALGRAQDGRSRVLELEQRMGELSDSAIRTAESLEARIKSLEAERVNLEHDLDLASGLVRDLESQNLGLGRENRELHLELVAGQNGVDGKKLISLVGDSADDRKIREAIKLLKESRPAAGLPNFGDIISLRADRESSKEDSRVQSVAKLVQKTARR